MRGFLLVLLATTALAPTAAASADICSMLADGCPPPPASGCAFNLYWVSGQLPTEGCAASVTLSSCDVEWFGGHGIWSARVSCTPIATLP